MGESVCFQMYCAERVTSKDVKGDLHGEKLVNANGLEQLKYVGGRIFFQENQFLSLEEFRNFIKL